MDTLIEFFKENIDLQLLILIVVGGVFIKRYFSDIKFIKNSYKVLIASFVFAAISYFLKQCTLDCILKYLTTYFFATSFYELIVKWIITFFDKRINNPQNT